MTSRYDGTIDLVGGKYSMGIVIAGNHYIIRFNHPGFLDRPDPTYMDYAYLAYDLYSKKCIRWRGSKSRRSSNMTRKEVKSFREAMDVTEYWRSRTFFSFLRDGMDLQDVIEKIKDLPKDEEVKDDTAYAYMHSPGYGCLPEQAPIRPTNDLP